MTCVAWSHQTRYTQNGYRFSIYELGFFSFKRKRRVLKEKYECCVCPETYIWRCHQLWHCCPIHKQMISKEEALCWATARLTPGSITLTEVHNWLHRLERLRDFKQQAASILQNVSLDKSFLTWGPWTSDFKVSMNSDEKKIINLFSLTSNWNLAVHSTMNIGNKVIYGL